ncbi:hypothetical protein GW746_01765, partial [Candidatus Saccharibacteria bacterium]|nr:hypothetical protein [Candidatus Saccharibacteria bacterium]
MDIIETTFQILLQPYVWGPVALLFGYLAWRNWRKLDAAVAAEGDLLILEIPKTNDKKELAAEQMFASLHGILRDRMELRESGGV